MCDNCDYIDYIDLCDELLDNLDYEYAVDTVQGIKNWIEKNQHVTEKQKTALHNIEEHPSESY